ncbi:unnamed protein product, partial [Laminaria digitata]
SSRCKEYFLRKRRLQIWGGGLGVLSRKHPWEDECLRNIFVRVVIKEQRPEIPADSPADLVKIINACWECVPSNRPTFNDRMQSIRAG